MSNTEVLDDLMQEYTKCFGEGFPSFQIMRSRSEKESLADINPHPLKVVFDYSHPTLSQRITAIEGIKDFGEVM